MKALLTKIAFFPLDLIYLTLDATIISVRVIKRVFKKQKLQRCHFCQGEANQEANHPVRSVLKYQNKWMVRLLSPCIRFKADGKRQLGFCQNEGYYTRPPAYVPLVALGMISFWLLGSLGLLMATSSDPDNFGKNFISTFVPSTLGESEDEINFLEQGDTQLNPERAERYFLMGVKALDKQNIPEAQVNFKIASQSNPTDPDIHFHLAKSYFAMGQQVQGEASLRKTLELDAEYVEALLQMAQLMEQRENRQEALNYAKTALEKAPDNLQAIRMNAGLSAVSGDTETARTLMDQLYAREAENPDTLTFLGRLEFSVFQDVETAKARLEAALAIDEDYVPALLAMISVYLQENNLEQVDATVAKILTLDPENLSALRIEADLILNRYGMGAGLRAYTRLINRFASDQGLRLRYAELLLRAGKISEGKKFAQQLTASREPQFERAAHWMLAQMYAQVRMHEEAVAHARSTLRLSPNGQNIHLFLSQQLMALDELGDARREAEFALSMNRQDIRAVNLVTQAMVMMGDTNEAIALLDRLVEEFPEQDGVRMRRIEILMQSDRWQEALGDTRMLREKYPDNAALKNNLAFLLARSGQDLDLADTLSQELAGEFADNPIIMDTRAYVLAAAGQHEAALKIYEEALAKAGDNVVIRYHYAKSLVASGRQADAVPQLQALLMINPNFPQAEEARSLLASLTPEAG